MATRAAIRIGPDTGSPQGLDSLNSLVPACRAPIEAPVPAQGAGWPGLDAGGLAPVGLPRRQSGLGP
jgi:hypothetical protein